MKYYEDAIINYLEQNGSVYKKITKKKCIKLVFKLLIHNEMYNGHYNNTQWWFYLGFYYDLKKDYDNMIKYYLMAIDKGDISSINNLAYFFEEQKDYDNMIKYYLMAIDKGNDDAMQNLGYYYEKKEDYDNMMKYYLMAIDKGKSGAMHNLGYYYEQKEDYDNMIKYYLMAIEKGHNGAMNNLGYYYKEQKNYDNMIKYYLMAIDNNNKLSIDNLNFVIDNLPKTLLPKLLPNIKYLTKKNIIIMNKNVETELIDCVVCYESNQKCIKNCVCGQNIMCKSCYMKWSKCVNCEN